MKEEKEPHHAVKYRGLKERKRQKAIIKRRQTKRESAKTQHGESRKITNDVLVPGCGIFIPADLTQVHRKKKEEFREKLHTFKIMISIRPVKCKFFPFKERKGQQSIIFLWIFLFFWVVNKTVWKFFCITVKFSQCLMSTVNPFQQSLKSPFLSSLLQSPIQKFLSVGFKVFKIRRNSSNSQNFSPNTVIKHSRWNIATRKR